MDLREYFFRKRIRQMDFAEALGVSKEYISRITLGKDIPSEKLAQKIYDATDGDVDIRFQNYKKPVSFGKVLDGNQSSWQ